MTHPHFESLPAPERGLRRIELIAALFGLSPAPPVAARVLDIGCGNGTMLLSLAAQFPESRCVGIDLSPDAVARGNERRQALGLTNVEFREGDFRDSLDEGETFDYIVAHGLYSWCPAPVRDDLLSRIRTHLAAQGVAVVSVNSWPGFFGQSMVRRLLTFLAPDENISALHTSHARDALRTLAGLLDDSSGPYSLLLRREFEAIERQSDAYLDAGILNPAVDGASLGEMRRAAAGHTLRIVADAKVSNWRQERLPELPGGDKFANELLGYLASEKVEELLEILLPVQVRSLVLCHAEIPVSPRPNWDVLADSWLLSKLVRPEAGDIHYLGSQTFFTPAGGEVEVYSPVMRDMLLKLAEAWPEGLQLSALYQSVTGRTLSKESADWIHLRTQCGSWFLQGVLECARSPWLAARDTAEYPTVDPLARLQLQTQSWATTLLDEYAECDPLGRAVAALSDGSRPISQIAETLYRQCLPPQSTRSADLEEVPREEFDLEIRAQLKGLAAAALLRAPTSQGQP